MMNVDRDLAKENSEKIDFRLQYFSGSKTQFAHVSLMKATFLKMVCTKAINEGYHYGEWVIQAQSTISVPPTSTCQLLLVWHYASLFSYSYVYAYVHVPINHSLLSE